MGYSPWGWKELDAAGNPLLAAACCVCAQLLPDPGIERASPTLAGGLFQHCDAWEAPLLAASDLKDHPARWSLWPLGRQDPPPLSPSQHLSPFLLGPECGGWRRGGGGRVLHSMSPS